MHPGRLPHGHLQIVVAFGFVGYVVHVPVPLVMLSKCLTGCSSTVPGSTSIFTTTSVNVAVHPTVLVITDAIFRTLRDCQAPLACVTSRLKLQRPDS